MTDGLNNFIQIFNEIIVLLSIQLLYIYTNYVDSPTTRYELAWYFLYLMAFVCIVNILFMFYVIFSKIYQAIRKAYLKRVHKRNIDLKIQQADNSQIGASNVS